MFTLNVLLALVVFQQVLSSIVHVDGFSLAAVFVESGEAGVILTGHILQL